MPVSRCSNRRPITILMGGRTILGTESPDKPLDLCLPMAYRTGNRIIGYLVIDLRKAGS